VDAAGNFYVGTDNQVHVFDSAGKPLRTIGRQGGRALSGPWTPDGMAFISGVAVDAAGKLWVAEKCERRNGSAFGTPRPASSGRNFSARPTTARPAVRSIHSIQT